MNDGELIDRKYFPEGFHMDDPNQLAEPKRMALLKHLFLEVGEVTFKKWKPRAQPYKEPVGLDERWWASDPDMLALQQRKEKALQARPVHRVRAGDAIQEERAPDAHPGPGPGPDPAPTSVAGSLQRLSPYGSSLAHSIHNRDLWEEDQFAMPMRFWNIPDPDDYIPLVKVPSTEDPTWPPPCLVAPNAEARAQWSYEWIEKLSSSPEMPRALMRTVVTKLAELPVSP